MTKPIFATGSALLLLLALAPLGTAEPGGDDHQIATGPCGISEKSIVSAGFGNCTPAIFDVRHWNADPQNTGHRMVTFWAEWIQGSGVFLTGFQLVGCSDRDDNGQCTNVSTPPDDIGIAYSNDGIHECEKDDKNCQTQNPYDAVLAMCITADLDGQFDDLHAFIDIWTGVDNVGTGISTGDYDVFLTYGPWVPEC